LGEEGRDKGTRGRGDKYLYSALPFDFVQAHIPHFKLKCKEITSREKQIIFLTR
jgi:hypothetical protein